MRAFFRSLWRTVESLLPDLRDCFAFGGLGLAAYGASLIYEPAAWLLAGGVLFWLGIRKE